MRLIDADALKARFYMKDDCSDCHACDYDETYIDPGIICSTIDDMPTIEPKIIRCKECKYYEIAWLKKDGTDNKRYKPSICVRGQYGITRKPDWYCADAERRGEQGE